MKRSHSAALVTALILLLSLAVSAAAWAAPFKCVVRTAKFLPPPRTMPFAVNIRLGQDAGVKEGSMRVAPPLLKPVCPTGSVPVSTAPTLFSATLKAGLGKGNPLIGPDPTNLILESKDRAAFIRSNLRPFKQVYWKGHGDDEKDYRQLDPPGCLGVSSFGSCYYYANAAQRRDADGGGMTTQIERPAYVGSGGPGHTLDEIAVQGGPKDGNIIELGWNISTNQYADADPHLFVFHWINWSSTCYDDCNWQQYSSTYYPHQNLSGIVGRSVYIGYVFYRGNWWAWFDNQWLGYFPGTEWSGSYTRNGLIQWFGEVSTANGIPPMTQMGDGILPPAAGAAQMTTLCDVDAAHWVCWYRDQQVLGATHPAWYDIVRTGFGATAYGGPGR